MVEEGLLQLLTHLSQLALLSGSVAQWLSETHSLLKDKV